MLQKTHNHHRVCSLLKKTRPPLEFRVSLYLPTLLPFWFFFGTSVIVSPEQTISLPIAAIEMCMGPVRTGWKTLLQLLRLIRVFEDERVEVALASDLEFRLVRRPVLLYPRSCAKRNPY